MEELLERAVSALERLAQDPIVEIEAGPPVCPACGAFNPQVTITEGEATGPMFEYFAQVTCNSCQQRFYALPDVWRMFLRREELTQEILERRELLNVNNGT
jgi:hypothetical protein